MKLIPPDVARCQSEKLMYNAFVMGGTTHRWQRCDNKPTVIATERKPGPDGKRGAMSLCVECKVKFEEKLGKTYASYKIIQESS